MRRKTVLVDIDGTIADGEHRQHWVRTKPKNWAAYNKTMSEDLPIYQTITVINSLSASGHPIIICSGREEVYRDATEYWLNQHNVPYKKLMMRPEKDYRDDCTIKSEMLDKILETEDVMCVFDDRPKVTRMWVERGIFVFRCQQIECEF